jgi:glucose/arabinose dehydrogenase
VRLRHVLVLVVVALAASPAPAGATPPPGFSQTEVATGLSQPTALAPAPDGRLFIAEKGGTVKVLDGGALKTVLSLPVDTASERGLIGIALHPAFPGVPRVYVHYTATSPTVHNRVSWFTLAGDTLSGETVVLDLPTLGAGNHNGGAIHFGPDGDLYVGVGENAVPANAPDLSTPLGKILRVDPDGAIPPDNPSSEWPGPTPGSGPGDCATRSRSGSSRGRESC